MNKEPNLGIALSVIGIIILGFIGGFYFSGEGITGAQTADEVKYTYYFGADGYDGGWFPEGAEHPAGWVADQQLRGLTRAQLGEERIRDQVWEPEQMVIYNSLEDYNAGNKVVVTTTPTWTATSAQISSGTETYTVQSGNTLGDIARQNLIAKGNPNPTPVQVNTEIQRIAGLNSIQNINVIQLGQILTLVSPEATGGDAPDVYGVVTTAENVDARIAWVHDYLDSINAEEGEWVDGSKGSDLRLDPRVQYTVIGGQLYVRQTGKSPTVFQNGIWIDPPVKTPLVTQTPQTIEEKIEDAEEGAELDLPPGSLGSIAGVHTLEIDEQGKRWWVSRDGQRIEEVQMLQDIGEEEAITGTYKMDINILSFQQVEDRNINAEFNNLIGNNFPGVEFSQYTTYQKQELMGAFRTATSRNQKGGEYRFPIGEEMYYFDSNGQLKRERAGWTDPTVTDPAIRNQVMNALVAKVQAVPAAPTAAPELGRYQLNRESGEWGYYDTNGQWVKAQDQQTLNERWQQTQTATPPQGATIRYFRYDADKGEWGYNTEEGWVKAKNQGELTSQWRQANPNAGQQQPEFPAPAEQSAPAPTIDPEFQAQVVNNQNLRGIIDPDEYGTVAQQQQLMQTLNDYIKYNQRGGDYRWDVGDESYYLDRDGQENIVVKRDVSFGRDPIVTEPPTQLALRIGRGPASIINWEDLGGHYQGVKILVNIGGTEIEVKSYDLNAQTVTLIDGTVKELRKDNGRVVFKDGTIPQLAPPPSTTLNWADIGGHWQDTDGNGEREQFITINGEEIPVLSFNADAQTVTLLNGEVKRIVKDASGQIELIDAPPEVTAEQKKAEQEAQEKASKERREHIATIISRILHPTRGALEIEAWVEKAAGKDLKLYDWRKDDSNLGKFIQYSVAGYETYACDNWLNNPASEYFVQDYAGHFATGANPLGLVMFVNGKRSEYEAGAWQTQCRFNGQDPKWFPGVDNSGNPIRRGYLYKLSWHISHPFTQAQVEGMSRDEKRGNGLDPDTGAITYKIQLKGEACTSESLPDNFYLPTAGVTPRTVERVLEPGQADTKTLVYYDPSYMSNICIRFDTWRYDGRNTDFPVGCAPTEGLGLIRKEQLNVPPSFAYLPEENSYISEQTTGQPTFDPGAGEQPRDQPRRGQVAPTYCPPGMC